MNTEERPMSLPKSIRFSLSWTEDYSAFILAATLLRFSRTRLELHIQAHLRPQARLHFATLTSPIRCDRCHVAFPLLADNLNLADVRNIDPFPCCRSRWRRCCFGHGSAGKSKSVTANSSPTSAWATSSVSIPMPLFCPYSGWRGCTPGCSCLPTGRGVCWERHPFPPAGGAARRVGL